MKIGKSLILPLIVSMLLGLVMVGPVGAAGTTIGVEPKDTIDVNLRTPSTFTVEIWIRNVANLAGVEFKLGYDTSVLTADWIEYGGLFGSLFMPLINATYDDLGYLFCGFMRWPGQPGFTGDGKAAIIHFSVDSVGESILNLYDTLLGDTTPVPVPIDHVALDGYFRNYLISVTLVKKSAWPEHHHYKLLGDEDTSNDLFAIVANKGEMNARVKVVFTVTWNGDGIPIGDYETATMLLAPGQFSICSTTFEPPMPGKYYVSAQALADTNGDTVPDTVMGKIKGFSLSAVP